MQQNNEQGFRSLFDRYYVALCRYVNTLIEDEAESEDITQGVFIYLWEHRSDLVITSTIRTYLFAACRYKALNYLRNTRKFTRFVPELQESIYEDLSVEAEELCRLVEEAVMTLPEKCHRIFHLSREEKLSHKEIAEQEGIAVKTVEAQIHIAIKRLRKYLATHLNIF